MKILQLAPAVLVAAFTFGSIPAFVVTPTAVAQQMPADKPDEPNESRGDGCIPIGVTKSSTGAVYAEENATERGITGR